MEWRGQSYTGLRPWPLATLIVAGLLGPPGAHALESMEPAYAAAKSAAWKNPRSLPDPELARVWAKGFSAPQVNSDRLFDGTSTYATEGIAVSVLGTLALLLNPPTGAIVTMMNAERSFNFLIFNPNNPTSVVGLDGTMLVRRASTIKELGFRSVELRSSGGQSYGSAEIRGIEMGGTRVIIRRH